MRRVRLWGAAALAAAALAACATPAPPPPSSFPPYAAPTSQPLPPGAVPLGGLSGWPAEDHAAALRGFAQTCRLDREPALEAACGEARGLLAAGLGPRPENTARLFFERRFAAVPLDGEGLLTGYYAPEHQARTRPDAEFSAPLRAKPADLVTMQPAAFAAAATPTVGRMLPGGAVEPYPDRAAIEARPPAPGEALAWMRPEELFFLQIQGSGYLTFEDGSRRRAAFAAHNGRPFVGLAKIMRERGLLADDQTSAANIRAWLAAHRGAGARALMWENPRYVFFRLDPDDGRDPPGAANVVLPAGRAVAVDPAHHAYGGLLWIDADAGALAGSFPAYRRLVTALDTGGAIRGPVRADLYIGRGSAAGVEAGRIRHRLRMHRLVPR